jgi:hypothetical protein
MGRQHILDQMAAGALPIQPTLKLLHACNADLLNISNYINIINSSEEESCGWTNINSIH